MDGHCFDRITRSLSGTSPRRTIARAMIGAALGGVVGLPLRLEPGDAAAKCVKLDKACGKGDRCCGGAKCLGRRCRCTGSTEVCGGRCADLTTDPANCGACGVRCAAGAACLHGTCSCDPFANHCPMSAEGQCTCAAVVGPVFRAACTDRNSACDLDKPCTTNDDCPLRGVCLIGCRDADDPDGPNRCSKPCDPA